MQLVSPRAADLPRTMRAVSEALSADALDDAARLLDGAARANPGRADIFAVLARVQLKRCDLDSHDAALDRAITLDPGNAGYRIRAAIACPPMMSTRAEIDRIRSRALSRLAALAPVASQLRLVDPQVEVPTLTYYFTYHGQDDRELNRRLASVLRAAHPALAGVAPHCFAPRAPAPKIRLGILSTYLRDHTIGNLFSGLITQLDRSRFQRVLIFSEADLDARSVALAESGAEEVVLISRRLPEARATVASQRLDVLWYPDLGMDSLTMYLAHARLAHAQLTTWGHPNTTGVPTVDAFLSLDALEPERADPPYTEALITQPTPNICLAPPQRAARLDRAALGLPVGKRLYGCPQTLFKLHPDFDEVLCAILDRDPEGMLVLHQGRTRRWRALLEARLEALRPGVTRRIHWMTSMPRPRYIETLAAFDVMLDPFPFGGGNTTLEAIAVGTPVVTLPPRLARGRLAAAFYQQLGWTGPVASSPADYVARAVRFATDPEARDLAQQALARGGHRLFNNTDGVRQFEDRVAGLLTERVSRR